MPITRRVYVSLPADPWLAPNINALKWGLSKKSKSLATRRRFLQPERQADACCFEGMEPARRRRHRAALCRRGNPRHGWSMNVHRGVAARQTLRGGAIPKFLFGDDIFVSYSRADGATYAAGLGDELRSGTFRRGWTNGRPSPVRNHRNHSKRRCDVARR